MYKNIQQELFMNSLKQSYKQYHQDKLMQIKYMYMYICIYHQTNKFNVKRITRKVVLTFLWSLLKRKWRPDMQPDHKVQIERDREG